MKKVVVAVVAVIGLLGTMGYAAWQGADGQVDVNAFRQFQKETLPLRDEMMAKGLELRNEYNKQKPDQDRIAKLGTEMGALRTQIQAVAEKQGLPAFGNGPGMNGAGWGRGAMMMSRGGCGYGRGRGAGMMGGGYGRGPGFGGGPGRGNNCPMWQ
jgi:hypothetical protein